MAEKNTQDNQKNKKKHRWIGIILISLLLLFIGLAGYYLERDLEPVPDNQIEDSPVSEQQQESSNGNKALNGEVDEVEETEESTDSEQIKETETTRDSEQITETEKNQESKITVESDEESEQTVSEKETEETLKNDEDLTDDEEGTFADKDEEDEIATESEGEETLVEDENAAESETQEASESETESITEESETEVESEISTQDSQKTTENEVEETTVEKTESNKEIDSSDAEAESESDRESETENESKTEIKDFSDSAAEDTPEETEETQVSSEQSQKSQESTSETFDQEKTDGAEEDSTSIEDEEPKEEVSPELEAEREEEYSQEIEDPSLLDRILSVLGLSENDFTQNLNILFVGLDDEESVAVGTIEADSIMLSKLRPEENLLQIEHIEEDRVYNGQSLREYHNGDIQVAVEDITNSKVDYYVYVKYQGFEKVIDELGGVTINLNEKVEVPGLGLKLKAGDNLLSGKEALNFVRWSNSDSLARFERQKLLIKAIITKLKGNNILFNIKDLYNTIVESYNSVETDINPVLAAEIFKYIKDNDDLELKFIN